MFNKHHFHWSNDSDFTEITKALIEYGAIIKHKCDKNITYSIPSPDLEILQLSDNEHFAAMRKDVVDLLMAAAVRSAEDAKNDLKRSKLNQRKRANYANNQALKLFNEKQNVSKDFDPNKEKVNLERLTQHTIANHCCGGYEMISDVIWPKSHSQQCSDLIPAEKRTCLDNNNDGIECTEYNCVHGGKGCDNRKYLTPHLTSCYPRKSHLIDGIELVAFERIPGLVYIGQYAGVILEDGDEKRNDMYIMKMNLSNRSVLVDSSKKGNLTRFINHSCNPNCEYLHRTVEGTDQIWIKTKRDIKAGDTLTCNYGWDPKYWEDTPCMCGYKECKFKNNGHHEDPEAKLKELHSGGYLMSHKADGNCGYHVLITLLKRRDLHNFVNKKDDVLNLWRMLYSHAKENKAVLLNCFFFNEKYLSEIMTSIYKEGRKYRSVKSKKDWLTAEVLPIVVHKFKIKRLVLYISMPKYRNSRERIFERHQYSYKDNGIATVNAMHSFCKMEEEDEFLVLYRNHFDLFVCNADRKQPPEGLV